VTTPNDHNPIDPRLLDHLRGESAGGPDGGLDAEIARDPALAAERARLARLLSVAARAHEAPLDATDWASAATRVAARARDAVRRQEDRRPVHEPKSIWVRVLAISVGLHVAVLGFLALRTHEVRVERSDSPDVRPFGEEVARATPPAEEPSPEAPPRESGPSPLAPYVVADETPPIETVLEGLPRRQPAEDGPPGNPLVFRPGLERSMWLRTNAVAKKTVREQLGTESLAGAVERGLAALAARQTRDGSFESVSTRTREGATALVLLAFLSEGHSSRGGAYRAVVEKGIAWLRAQNLPALPLEDRAFALLAASEDLMLGNGAMTPAESLVRGRETAALARSLSAARDRARSKLDGTTAAWAALALSSAARLDGRGVPVPDLTAFVPGNGTPDVLQGTSLLLGKRVREFRSWSKDALPTLAARVGDDGLVRDVAEGPARVEETALVLLALQVSYRTY
jgi:hypothetical protein